MSKKIRISLLLALLLLSLWTGFDQYRLTQQEMLWGYRPLLLLAASWGVFILLSAPRFSPIPGHYRLLGWSTLSGLLLALGFPDLLPAPFLMFVALVPLLWVESQIAQQAIRRQGWEVVKFGYHTFVVWNIFTTYWVINSSLLAGLVAILVNSALMCIPLVLFHYTKRAMPRLGYLSLIVFWITFEYVHLNWDLSWPWLTLGNSFAEVPSWVQWYEYTGVFGGSLWVLLANVWFFRMLEKNDWQWQTKGLIRPGLLIFIPIGFSAFQYFQYEEKSDPIDVLVIQPNFEPHYEKFSLPEEVQMDRLLQLTEANIDGGVDYVVFPETSFGYIPTNQLNDYPAVRQIRDLLVSYPQAKVITGIEAVHYFQPGETLTKTARQGQTREGATVFYEIINGAVEIGPGIAPIPLYKKSKLVPGPEIFPFRKLLFFLQPLVESLGGTTAGLATQAQRAVFSAGKARIGPVICYESVFGEYFTGYIKQGAQAIFIMTNDGWWDHTAGHRQHLYFASLRAIETRRSIARSANTGISALINQRGEILQPTHYDEAGAIRGKINLNHQLTFYVQWGDIIARLAMFTAILLLLNTLAYKLKGER